MISAFHEERLLVTVLGLLTILSVRSAHADTVFDNTANDAPLWVAPSGPEELIAQQFLLGANDTVTEVGITMSAAGTPSGLLHVEIWDDSGSGTPGNVVGTVGSIDLASLPTSFDVHVFGDPVDGLTPHEPFYIVHSPVDASVNVGSSVRLSTGSSSDGTNGAAKAMAMEDAGVWFEIADQFGPSYNYFSMYVIAELQLQPGDANQDLEFNFDDVLAVLAAGKFETGDPATWAQGDWNGAPGGRQGDPPPGDGSFDFDDILAALSVGLFETGPYAAQSAGNQVDAPSAVPEPSGFAIALIGLGFSLRFRRFIS